MRGRILVVDDEPAILEVVRLNLEAEGYEVEAAASGAEALQAFAARPSVLAILDVMLPDVDGFELARLLRERSDLPIIMLSARDSDVDKAVGLGVGADDYVTKPFSPVELVARVKAHLRRYVGAAASAVSVAAAGAAASAGAAGAPRADASGGDSAPEVLEAGPLRMDAARRSAAVFGRELDLTAKEFDILWMLAEHPGRVYTKAQIYERVWHEPPFGDLSTVQVHVRRLRTKIEEHPEQPTLLTTVWGIGYRFEEAD